MTSLITIYVCLHHDVILRKKSKTWPNEYVLDLYFFNLIRWIQSCDKKNLAYVDCLDKNLIKPVLKNVIKFAIGLLINIFQDSFSKIYLNS